jgi:hypothetical protein
MIRIMPTHSGFEPGRSDYQRAERLWPASTGWLIVSILFANKLWIGDVTSMSLYWVARLPIERPIGQPSREPRAALPKPRRSRRQWKIALSFAIVGTLAAPFVFRTYNARPTYSVWVPLSPREKENLAAALQNSNYCQRETTLDVDAVADVVADFICYKDKEKFELGGHYEYHPDWPKYLAVNLAAAAATFVSIFGLALLIPISIHALALSARRYWN